MARSDKRKEEKNRRNFDDPLWIGSSGLVHVFLFYSPFWNLLFWFKQPAPPSKAPSKTICVFFCGEKKNNTKMLVQIFFFFILSCFYAHLLIFSVSGPFGLFPFLVPFWMEHVDTLFLPTALFVRWDGCSWRFLHLLDNSLFPFRIIKRVSATMMETFEKPTASFSFGFFRFLFFRRVAETTWLSCLTFDLFPRANKKCESAEWIEEGALGFFFFFKFY